MSRTAAGRLLAALMMFTGIGLFGTFTAYVASAFLAPGEADQDRELAEIRQEMARLREILEKTQRRVGASPPSVRWADAQPTPCRIGGRRHFTFKISFPRVLNVRLRSWAFAASSSE